MSLKSRIIVYVSGEHTTHELSRSKKLFCSAHVLILPALVCLQQPADTDPSVHRSISAINNCLPLLRRHVTALHRHWRYIRTGDRLDLSINTVLYRWSTKCNYTHPIRPRCRFKHRKYPLILRKTWLECGWLVNSSMGEKLIEALAGKGQNGAWLWQKITWISVLFCFPDRKDISSLK